MGMGDAVFSEVATEFLLTVLMELAFIGASRTGAAVFEVRVGIKAGGTACAACGTLAIGRAIAASGDSMGAVLSGLVAVAVLVFSAVSATGATNGCVSSCPLGCFASGCTSVCTLVCASGCTSGCRLGTSLGRETFGCESCKRFGARTEWGEGTVCGTIVVADAGCWIGTTGAG
jgi:hypothetical protein